MKTIINIRIKHVPIFLLIIFVAFLYSTSIHAQTVVHDHRNETTYVPLDHFWSSLRTDNYSTANTEAKKGALKTKYRFVRTDGYILKKPSNIEGKAVPLYLYYSPARKDNFITATPEGIRAAVAGGYRKVRVEGYVLKTVKPEYIHLYKPLWLYYSHARKDNFTIATPQGMKTAEAGGYRKVRIEGYVRIKDGNRITGNAPPPSSSTLGCSLEKIEGIFAPATNANQTVIVNCNLHLTNQDLVNRDNDIHDHRKRRITKRLIFEGNKSSNITCDFNGAILDGGVGSINYKRDMIEVKSEYIDSTNTWERPHNVFIKNAKIIGSIRVWGMGTNGEDPNVKESSKREASNSKHVQRVRNNAPKNIVFDGITITGVGRNPLYFSPGVTYCKLINSEMNGKSDKVGIYLDAESAYNTFENNYLHVDTKEDELHYNKNEKWYKKIKPGYNRGWPQMAIDGSSHNKIINNRFSNINNGGIYLYRNCGEGGTIRHTPPEYNTINNNVFYYKKYNGNNPAIYLGSRNYGWKERAVPFSHCDDDDGRPYGSSKSEKDYAKYNTIRNNKFYNRKIMKQGALKSMLVDATPEDLIITKGKSTNSPNYISDNKMIKSEK